MCISNGTYRKQAIQKITWNIPRYVHLRQIYILKWVFVSPNNHFGLFSGISPEVSDLSHKYCVQSIYSLRVALNAVMKQKLVSWTYQENVDNYYVVKLLSLVNFFMGLLPHSEVNAPSPPWEYPFQTQNIQRSEQSYLNIYLF